MTEKEYAATALPDTGIYSCSDNTTTIPCPQNGESFYGQDGQFNIPARQHNYTLHVDANESRDEDTVTDNVTGLMWMRNDNNSTYQWQQADTYCDNLTYADYDDWRLPNFHELAFLLDRSHETNTMAIDALFYGHADIYWTGTLTAVNAGYAWHVGFGDGLVFYHVTTNTYYARCVRSVQ